MFTYGLFFCSKAQQLYIPISLKAHSYSTLIAFLYRFDIPMCLQCYRNAIGVI
jgi:hypothetical protein